MKRKTLAFLYFFLIIVGINQESMAQDNNEKVKFVLKNEEKYTTKAVWFIIDSMSKGTKYSQRVFPKKQVLKENESVIITGIPSKVTEIHVYASYASPEPCETKQAHGYFKVTENRPEYRFKIKGGCHIEEENPPLVH